MITKKEFIERIESINEWGAITILGNNTFYIIDLDDDSNGAIYNYKTKLSCGRLVSYHGYDLTDLLVVYEEESFKKCQWDRTSADVVDTIRKERLISKEAEIKKAFKDMTEGIEFSEKVYIESTKQCNVRFDNSIDYFYQACKNKVKKINEEHKKW